VQLVGSNPVLAVHDLERSAAWFCSVLGCERSDPDPGNWVFCTSGAVTFMLGRCPDALPASALGDHSYVAARAGTPKPGRAPLHAGAARPRLTQAGRRSGR
jgi:catechol 2,3-dioxygenase-like lactoylglutathione lyase family enzyme